MIDPEFTLDELLLIYDMTCKVLFTLSASHNEFELRHYNELREKLYQALQKRS